MAMHIIVVSQGFDFFVVRDWVFDRTRLKNIDERAKAAEVIARVFEKMHRTRGKTYTVVWTFRGIRKERVPVMQVSETRDKDKCKAVLDMLGSTDTAYEPLKAFIDGRRSVIARLAIVRVSDKVFVIGFGDDAPRGVPEAPSGGEDALRRDDAKYAMLDVCHGCLAPAKGKRCAGCNIASYCCKDCQRSDWGQHKGVCQTLKARLGLATMYKMV